MAVKKKVKENEEKWKVINTQAAIDGILLVVLAVMCLFPDFVQKIADIAKDGTIWEILLWSLGISLVLSVAAGLVSFSFELFKKKDKK